MNEMALEYLDNNFMNQFIDYEQKALKLSHERAIEGKKRVVVKNKELKEIQDLIKKSINVEVEFDTPKALGLNEIRRTYNRDVEISESKIHRGSLRSGQRLEYEGTLIVLGDVNDGAEVIAGDNVVVVGNLRGLAHAGAKGNKQAIVAAHRIDTHQLRIANIIKELVKDDDAYNVAYTYAYVHENGREIVLE